MDVLVFAPLGAGAKFITDGPHAVERVRQELANARFIGEMVVGQGAARLKAKAAETSVDQPPADPAVDLEQNVEPDDVVEAPTDISAVDADVSPVDEEPTVDSLAIPDYDVLPAIDIIDQLESLSAAELAAVETYERANRRRRTVLGKLSQMAAER